MAPRPVAPWLAGALNNAEAAGSRKAAIFDLWNTLVPYPAETGAEAIRALAVALEVEHDTLAASLVDGYPLMLGRLEDSLASVCAKLGIDPRYVSRAAADWRERHARLFRPRPDALPTLDELRSRGRLLAVISNCSSDCPGVWAASPLAPRFDATVFSCVDGVVKPDPRSYELALSRLGVLAADCVYVGDTAWELVTARAIGMQAFLLVTERPVEGWDGARLQTLSELLNFA